MYKVYKVYIAGRDGLTSSMWQRRGYEVVDSLEEADIVQFTGGADVDPALYGESMHKTTFSDVARDEEDMEAYHLALDLDIPMVGICRGGQFLNVANGGTMVQDTDNHAIGGTHDVLEVGTGDVIRCTSTHHQMMLETSEALLLGIANLATYKELGDGTNIIDDGDYDTEVVWYKDSKSLCFQPHPEFVDKDHECQEWYFKLVEEYLLG